MNSPLLTADQAAEAITANTPRVRWGLIGAGHIAAEFADGVKGSETGTLLAVGSRGQDTADAFGAQHGIERCYGSYQALLDDRDVDAVYIATPHPMHAEWAIKAAEAGKHILCEKPLGMNWPEAAAMIDAAQANDVLLMEAFMYRCHPQTAKLVELLRGGVVGKVGLIEATFSYGAEFNPESRTYAQELGGGGILDVGCYPMSMARLIAGVANGGTFAEPLGLRGHAHLGPTGVDHYATASVQFPGDILAQLTTGVGLYVPSGVKVFGSRGSITISDPWVPSRWNLEPLRIRVDLQGQESPQLIEVPASKDLYSYEADMVGRHIGARQAAFPGMSWDDTLGNMRALDRWRHEVGLIYEMEKPANVLHTITRRSLRAQAGTGMPYGQIEGVEKPVSRLILGTDSANNMPTAAILFDAFFEAGGNAFDTSIVYGGGLSEIMLGQWIRNRGIREQVVVIEKGANSPNNHPAGLSQDIEASLENTGLDYFDIYMIHRDNTDVPIEAWIDVLNEHYTKGHFHAYGLSNFSRERVQAAQAYAEARGLKGFSALSNNFSLARMLSPVWELCVSSSDPEYREWFEATQTPLLPWSSQARGFFTERASRENLSDEEFNRCWYSEDNFLRKERANALAKDKGVEPINIALAYVLCQPFPTFPMVGPRRHSEIRSTVQALDIQLTPQELAWLDLRTDLPR